VSARPRLPPLPARAPGGVARGPRLRRRRRRLRHRVVGGPVPPGRGAVDGGLGWPDARSAREV